MGEPQSGALTSPTRPKRPGAAFFLATVGENGRPHATRVRATWSDGSIHFETPSGCPGVRDLTARAACALTVGLEDGSDLVLEGVARRLPQRPALVVDGDPPAQTRYLFSIGDAFGVPTSEPFGATGWHFEE